MTAIIPRILARNREPEIKTEALVGVAEGWIGPSPHLAAVTPQER